MITTGGTPQHTLGCYLAVNDARSALDFYELAFGARRRGAPIVMEDGRIGHAELAIGDSVLMLADEFPEIDMLSPHTRGGASQSLYLRVSKPDAVMTLCTTPSRRAPGWSGLPPITTTAATPSLSTPPGTAG